MLFSRLSCQLASSTEPVLERIVAETRGNPLALLELPKGLTPTQLAGGFGLPAAVPLSASIEESFSRRLAGLPYDARRLLLLAAADPVGDPALLWRAAKSLDIPESAAADVESEDLLALGPRVVFRHPLIRSAVYRSAGHNERRAIHRALADATDGGRDPDRRAWHLAQGTSVPDEDVAAALEHSAARAQARGGVARLSSPRFSSARRCLRRIPGAGRSVCSQQRQRNATPATSKTLGLLVDLDAALLDALGRARVELLAAQVALEQQRGNDAGRLFLGAAAHRDSHRLEGLAQQRYLEMAQRRHGS